MGRHHLTIGRNLGQKAGVTGGVANCAGVTPGVEYGWFVWAIDGDDFDTAQGFGDSYYVGVLTFQDGAARVYIPTVHR